MNKFKTHAVISFKIWLTTALFGLALFFLIYFIKSRDFDSVFIPIIFGFIIYSLIAVPLLIVSMLIINKHIQKQTNKILSILFVCFCICTLLFELPFSILSGSLRGSNQILEIYFYFLISSLISSYFWTKKIF